MMKNLFTTISLADLDGVTGGDNNCYGYCPDAKQTDNSVTTRTETNSGVQVNPSVDVSVLPKNEKT